MNPSLEPNHWRSADLAKELGIPEKRLKDWVTRGWATAIQRPIWSRLGDLRRRAGTDTDCSD